MREIYLVSFRMEEKEHETHQQTYRIHSYNKEINKDSLLDMTGKTTLERIAAVPFNVLKSRTCHLSLTKIEFHQQIV